MRILWLVTKYIVTYWGDNDEERKAECCSLLVEELKILFFHVHHILSTYVSKENIS